MPTCGKCKTHFPNRIEIEGVVRNVSNRRFCLDCSPFQLHNTRQIDKPSQVQVGKKFCSRCKTEKDGSEFYLRRDGSDFSSYCKICTNREAIERQRAFKRKCVEYKGGKCSMCGYDKCDYSLIFHHTDPTQKEFGIANRKLTTFDDRIKKELDKCILLCSRCHGELHFQIDNALVAKLD